MPALTLTHLRIYQGDRGKAVWETSFREIYGALLALPPDSLFDLDVHTFVMLLKDNGLLRAPRHGSMEGFERRSLVGRWTSTAALGGDMLLHAQDKTWPTQGTHAGWLDSARGSTSTATRGFATPRQAQDPHSFVAGARFDEGQGPQV